MKSKKEIFLQMMGEPQKLQEFRQKAAKWALCHWNLVETLCRQEPPHSNEELETEIQKAIDTNDHAYYALLIYLQITSKEHGEKQ